MKANIRSGKETKMYIKTRKSKREENQPFSVRGQWSVSITLQGKICSKRFPPAKGDQMLHKNRNNQKIFSRTLKKTRDFIVWNTSSLYSVFYLHCH